MDSKKKAVAERIKSHAEALAKAQEYLETGANADWQGFQPLFTPKVKNGQKIPPHVDWITNVFIPNQEKAIREAEKKLDRLEQKS